MGFQLPVQSVPITTKAVSSNLVHGEVYSIHYMIKFVSDLRQVDGSSSSSRKECIQVLRFPPPIKHRHDVTEILLKVTLNTINLNINLQLYFVLLVTLLMNNVSNCISVDALLSL